MTDSSRPVVVITGAAKRVGAVMAEAFCEAGYDLAISYRHSRAEAEAVAARCEAKRAQSCVAWPLDLSDTAALAPFIENVAAHYGRIDALINNASSFFPTPLARATEAQWDELFAANTKAPFFLAQAAAPYLRLGHGCVVNLADVHGLSPLREHAVYSITKAGVVMLTRALARDLGPDVRVNAVAPGAILWPEQGLDEVTQRRIISRTSLKRQGSPEDVARTVLFLVRDADYITGQVIRVDGGRQA